GPAQEPKNIIGVFGSYTGDFFLQLFGLASLAIPVLLILIAIATRAFFSERTEIPARKAVGAGLLLLALSGFLALFPKFGFGLLEHSRSNGGAVGYVIEGTLRSALNLIGAAIVLTAASLLTLMLTMEVSFARIASWLRPVMAVTAEASRQLSAWWTARAAERRVHAEQREAERAEARRLKDEERKQQEEERRAREREEQIRLEQVRKQQEEERQRKIEEARRLKEQPIIAKPMTVKPVITEPVMSSAAVVSSGGATAGAAIIEPDDLPDSMEDSEPLAESARAGVSANRQRAAAILRARTARQEMERSGGRVSEVTMDPEVAEMISTASIVRTAPAEKEDQKAIKEQAARRKTSIETSSGETYKLPKMELLETPIGHHEEAEEELRDRATILAEKCKEFAVIGHIHKINPGPVVTTFEFKPDPGIKYSRVVGLAEDLCLALKAESIRIDRIPGKSTVGIEVPNLRREKICLREIIESGKFQRSESKLTIALGKTINGEEYIADLSKMPHLLIAGATGAGKSVTLNSIICSILYKASPEDVKFIMVDPKRVELGLYEGIPHLLTPIVTDPKRASNALKWAVNEMENRYRELATLGVRNIEQYNRQVAEMTLPTVSEDNAEARKPLPYIVIAIDELADLMMVARGDVETSIARLAQMARAVGIHLVLATQRPSVDIITGVIKANIPSRIAFRVSSKVDSRTIIDSNGAEALLGQGDMLFLPPGVARLIRVHGSFVNETEVKQIADHTRQQAEPDYNEQVTLSEAEADGAEGFEGPEDELFGEALEIVTEMGRASTSVLQRRLSIGYGRAAKILDTMERRGFIGPAEGSKPRKVLQGAFEFRERLGQILEEDLD
ncbi:MAG TPA: DNA translocase FtsK 4TM domain-containing protein, partial [Blastocatellia bacterium]|nr:DNA translocase FtsK 4TM domain-containing protein [Blastocatellia bacterium]